MSDEVKEPGTGSLTVPQPYLAQLELLFNGPLLKDSVVEKLDDLTKVNQVNLYQHKRIWVKEFKCEYYLDNGNGSLPTNWKRAVGRMVVNNWDNNEHYQKGDIVSLAGKLYHALSDNTDKSPATYEDIWEVVTGEIETYRFLFFNASEVTIYTEIRNPIFEVIKGDVIYEIKHIGTDEIKIPVLNPETGLAELENKEIIDAYVVQREDLKIKDGTQIPSDNEKDGGVPYTFYFYENEQPISLSGCINVK